MMRTTVDLPTDIHALAQELAHQQQKTISEVVAELIRNGLSGRSKAEITEIRWPTVTVGRTVTAEDAHTLEDE